MIWDHVCFSVSTANAWCKYEKAARLLTHRARKLFCNWIKPTEMWFGSSFRAGAVGKVSENRRFGVEKCCRPTHSANNAAARIISKLSGTVLARAQRFLCVWSRFPLANWFLQLSWTRCSRCTLSLLTCLPAWFVCENKKILKHLLKWTSRITIINFSNHSEKNEKINLF